MRHAGAVEHEPLRLGDRALVADGERDQHARVRRAGERGDDARAHRLTRALDEVGRTPDERRQPLVGAAVAHVAGGAQIVLEQPRFEVEAGRIDVAVRPLQPHVQLPAFARVNLRNGAGRFTLCARREPGKRQSAGHDDVGLHDALDGEGEARALRTVLRKIVDDPHDANIGAFGLRRQRIGEACFRAPRRIADAEHGGCNDQRDGAASRAGDRGTRGSTQQRNQRTRPDEGDGRRPWRELRERLHGGNAAGKGGEHRRHRPFHVERDSCGDFRRPHCHNCAPRRAIDRSI